MSRELRIVGFKISYIQRSDADAEIVSIEPKLDTFSTSKLVGLLRELKKGEVVRDAYVHGHLIVLLKFIKAIECEIKRRVGGGFLECLGKIGKLSHDSFSSAEEVREISSRCLKELRKIPLRYLSLFKDDIESAEKWLRKMISYRREQGMEMLDNQIKRIIEDIENHPRLADWTIEEFLKNMNNEYAQWMYSHLAVADELERFVKAMKMVGRELTIRIRITPEMLERLINGDFSDVHRQIEEKLKSLLL